MKRMPLAIIIVASGLSSTGCTKSEPKIEIAVQPGIALELPTGEFTLTEGLALTTPDGLECSFKEGKLRVKGRSFGAVRVGDKVKVDESGAVSVNGQKRPPADAS